MTAPRPVGSTASAPVPVPPVSPVAASGRGAVAAPWRRWARRRPVVAASLLLLALVTAAAVVGPWFLPPGSGLPSPDKGAQFLPPLTRGHLLGTDLNGRDLLYRIFQGARISLLIGFSGALISLVVGVGYGLVAGYAGGRTDELLMRLLEVINAVPRLVIVLVLVTVVEGPARQWLAGQLDAPGTWLGRLGAALPALRGLPGSAKTLVLVVSLGMIEWLTMARIVRGQVLVLKELPFVAAARSLGQTHRKILTRHLLPNLAGLIAIYLTLTIPAVILDESFLSYLGLGVDPSQASWGTLLSNGANDVNPVKSHWWLLVFPASFLSLTLLALNFLGDALRDALDPRRG